MKPLDVHFPGRIAFGRGRLSDIGGIARAFGSRVVIFSGAGSLRRSGVLDRLDGILKDAGMEPVHYPGVSREPDVEDIDAAVAMAREAGPEVVIGMGGGSVIDTAKAVAALVPDRQGASVEDFLEEVGKGLTLEVPPLPIIAVPTTSGTGSEATRNSVISSRRKGYKRSLRHPSMVPRVALLDPDLTIDLPRDVTIRTGMDALTQLIESHLTRRSNPFTDVITLEGIRIAGECLPRVVESPGDIDARSGMAYASLLSGIALANSGLGMAHGVAPALGIARDVPHGLACAVMLPAALDANRPICESRFTRIAEALTGRTFPSENEGSYVTIDFVRNLNRRFGVPSRLSALGVREGDIPGIVRHSRGSSMRGNPRELSDGELEAILRGML